MVPGGPRRRSRAMLTSDAHERWDLGRLHDPLDACVLPGAVDAGGAMRVRIGNRVGVGGRSDGPPPSERPWSAHREATCLPRRTARSRGARAYVAPRTRSRQRGLGVPRVGFGPATASPLVAVVYALIDGPTDGGIAGGCPLSIGRVGAHQGRTNGGELPRPRARDVPTSRGLCGLGTPYELARVRTPRVQTALAGRRRARLMA